MLRELQKDSSQVAFNQRVQLVAAVIDPRYGVPEIEETKYVIDAAKKLNRSLLTGSQTNLSVESKKKKEIYPESVEEMTEDFWLNVATIPEPNKHVRPQCAPVDESGETIPKRLQILTTDEAYQKFQEDYSSRVKVAMKKKCDEVRSKHTAGGKYSDAVNDRLDRMESMFPSKSWFISKKPCQTAMNQDHSTGLCKDCYSAKVNYDTLIKYEKSNCHCKTSDCPNWLCLCEAEECSCESLCRCDDCNSCQVILTKKTIYCKKENEKCVIYKSFNP